MRVLVRVMLLPVAALALMAAAAPGLSIGGFRSAHFGMDESSVRHAIESDFKLGFGDIVAGTDMVQQTNDLSVTVPGLLPGAGRARVDYVFGYQSHQLIEVNVSWAETADPANAPPALLRAGSTLQAYFEGENFPPGSAAVNMALPDGTMLLFRGTDVGGHAVLLTLSGPISKPGKDGHVTMTPALLSLVYAANPANPDVFKLPSGAF